MKPCFCGTTVSRIKPQHPCRVELVAIPSRGLRWGLPMIRSKSSGASSALQVGALPNKACDPKDQDFFNPKYLHPTRAAAGRRAVTAPSEAGSRAPESGQDALIEGKADTARRPAALPKPRSATAALRVERSDPAGETGLRSRRQPKPPPLPPAPPWTATIGLTPGYRLSGALAITWPCPDWPPPRRRAWPPPGRPGSGRT